MTRDFNDRLRQVFFLIALIALGILLFRQLYVFFPGFLGALTLYIVGRKWFKYLTEERNWRKGVTAALFLLAFLVLIATPVYFCIQMFYSKVEALLKDPDKITNGVNEVSAQVKEWTGQDLLSMDIAKTVQQKLGGFIPKLLNSSATALGNLLMILFLAFFMFLNGPALEKKLQHFIPLRRGNVDKLAHEITMMVKANAIGIPLVSVIQGLVAVGGYLLFGVKDPVLLGLVTGIFAFFPIVGTAVVWLPVVITLFASGENGRAIGLGLYSLIVTGNVDYVVRVTLLKKVGDVHPVTTILGLVAGLQLFGFWGFIFGPLLISSFLLLVNIYKSEFVTHRSSDRPEPKEDDA